jgi:hypothetical protein
LLNNSTDYQEPKFEDFAPLFGPGNVPGYLSQQDMEAISDLCKLLPDTGTLVEVGSFLGKSSVEFSKNFTKLQKDYTIVCIDSFNSPIHILEQLLIQAAFVVPTGCPNNLEMFKHYTRDYKNIFAVTGFFDREFSFPGMIDAVFEDSTHSIEYLNYALPFWWRHLSTGGILSGHDYLDEVRTAVDLFAALNRLEVKTFSDASSIWYIEKP